MISEFCVSSRLRAVWLVNVMAFAGLVLPQVAFAQPAILDDWHGSTGTASAGPGAQTTITTPDAHGFSTGDHLQITGATGLWAPLNTQVLLNIRVPLSSNGTTVYLNDTSTMENTPGQTYQIYPETSYGSCTSGNAREIVTLNSILDNRSVSVTRKGSTANHCPEDYFWGPLQRANTWTIVVTGPTTFTVPLNSSSFGSFSGSLRIARASSYAANPAPFWRPSAADGSPFAMSISTNHTQQFTIDGCPDKTNAVRCSLGYSDPLNQKGYGDYAAAGTLVVSGGSGTITLTAPFNNNTTHYTRTLQANELCWLWNFSENGLAFGTINRPWVISSVSGNPQTITIQNMGTGQGGAGVPDGVYAALPGGKQFYFPIFADFYAYWLSSATQGNYPTEYPAHTVKASGAPFSPTFNRIRFWFQWGANMSQIPMMWGTYLAFQPSTSTSHGYHSINIDSYANQWELYESVIYPQHWVGSQAMVPAGTDPSATGWAGYPNWTGESQHYMDILYRFYMNLSSIYGIPGAQTGAVGPMYMDSIGAEPDEWTSIRSVTYNPNGTRYHISILAPPQQPANVTYDFYHSTTDIKSTGLSQATHDGSATAGPTGVNNTIQAVFDSPTLTLAPTMYWAVVPTMPVSGVSGNGQSPIILSLRSDPNMQAGDHVVTSGIGGNTNANNSSSVQILSVSPRQFWYRLSPGYPNPKAPGILTGISVAPGQVAPGSPNVCTVSLTQPPGIVAGQEIAVTGAPTGGPGGNNAGTLTFFNVTGVSGNTFTFNCPGTSAGTYRSDHDTTHRLAIVVSPAIAIPGTGSGNWDGAYTGALVSAENAKNFAEIAFTPPSTTTSGRTPASACDLNGDGVVNSLDVQLAMQESLGASPCTVTVCNVVMVQDVINAANGGPCLLGQAQPSPPGLIAP